MFRRASRGENGEMDTDGKFLLIGDNLRGNEAYLRYLWI